MAPDQLSSDPAFLAAYGAVVGQLREEHGLDRKELASVADISYSYLSAIESGQRLPSAKDWAAPESTTISKRFCII